ncbi:MAG: NosD domain-containing protein [Candidatus Odinarchaeota archaeon]
MENRRKVAVLLLMLSSCIVLYPSATACSKVKVSETSLKIAETAGYPATTNQAIDFTPENPLALSQKAAKVVEPVIFNPLVYKGNISIPSNATCMVIEPVTSKFYVYFASNSCVNVYDGGISYIGTVGTNGESGSDNDHLGTYGRDMPYGGLAVDYNRLFVSDPGNNRVQVFEASSLDYQATIDCSSYDGSAPFGLDIDNDGFLYVAMYNGNVEVFDSSLNHQNTIETGLNLHTVAVDSKGRIYGGHGIVGISEEHEIPVYELSTGSHIYSITSEDETSFTRPVVLRTDEKDNLYVVSDGDMHGGQNRIQILDKDHGWFETIGVPNESGNDSYHLNNPLDVAFQEDLVYVLDSDNNRIQIFGPHERIIIDGNGDFATQANSENWPGSGTDGDPYIIGGYWIPAKFSYYTVISIKNTNVHFLIHNCSLENGDTGIDLYNVSNGKIFYNEITFNKEWAGINLYNCSNIEIVANIINDNYNGISLELCDHNIIDGNSVFDSDFYGIALDKSSHNQITWNDAIKSVDYGIYLTSASDFNNIGNNKVNHNSGHGFGLHYCANNTVSNNTVSQNNLNGFWMVHPETTGNLVKNNTVQSNGQDGIYIQAIIDNVFIDNRFYGNERGVYVSSTSQNNLIHMNEFCVNEVSARDDSSAGSTSWDDGLNGNWWDDYSGSGWYYLPGVAGASDQHPVTGVWHITVPTVLSGGSFTFRGPVIVDPSGTLVLRDSSFYFASPSPGSHYLQSYGSLIIENSYITATSGYEGYYYIRTDGGSVEIRDSSIIYAGHPQMYTPEEHKAGVVIQTSNAVIVNNEFIDNYYGLVGNLNNAMIINNRFYSCTKWGLHTYECSNMLIEGNVISSTDEHGLQFYNVHDSIIRFNYINDNYRGFFNDGPSTNNIFYGNIFRDNDIQATDNGNSAWDHSYRGNYWQDYSGSGSYQVGSGADYHPSGLPDLYDNFQEGDMAGWVKNTGNWYVDNWRMNSEPYGVFKSWDVNWYNDIDFNSSDFTVEFTYAIHGQGQLGLSIASPDSAIGNTHIDISTYGSMTTIYAENVGGETIHLDHAAPQRGYVRIEYADKNLDLWINDDFSYSCNVPDLRLGRVGFSVNQGSDKIVFDNLIVKAYDMAEPGEPDHYLSPPYITDPGAGGTYSGKLNIQWDPATDNLDHDITYDVYYSDDAGNTWIMIASDIVGQELTYPPITVYEHMWDTTTVPDGNDYMIKVITTCSGGLTSEDTTDGTFEIRNEGENDLVFSSPGFLAAFLLLTLPVVVLLRRRKTR